ncbi:MAG: hypothetical protein CVU17_08715 [Betaproteobacteria bacterium HGW-Betaproteobacteria-11]|nr:MAG: hypothetical protein CVU17_08715 [Betaproteobacteria bacterium HGW-Betaproteobacteria-11]
MRRFGLLLPLWLAACATAPLPSDAPTASAGAGANAPAARLSALARRRLASHHLQPIETRALNAHADCAFRDETGYRGSLELEVKAATVNRFVAEVDIPKRGRCQFRLDDFRQSGNSPILLTSRATSCQVNLWEQGRRVTVAFRDCRTECSGDAVDYLWPILVDNRKGQCS